LWRSDLPRHGKKQIPPFGRNDKDVRDKKWAAKRPPDSFQFGFTDAEETNCVEVTINDRRRSKAFAWKANSFDRRQNQTVPSNPMRSSFEKRCPSS